MRKNTAIPAFLISAAAILLQVFFGAVPALTVHASLDRMLSDQDMAIYSHTKFYAEHESYDKIQRLGSRAIGSLAVDYAAHPGDNLRRQLIVQLMEDIVS